ncbi:hypothetical protein [Aliihoeflea sp. 2WW]|uniref:hypothetical protein n=1 Tax=Aliihoeflea sp. 2WW TaxID=1381123 RepID=UPI00046700DD|nr:hypothetical protein [Aliihoeflea sp. 2WW]
MNDEPESHPVNRPPHPAEWIIGAASALGVLALIGYLCVTALTEADGPPVFEVAVDEVLAGSNGWHARISLRNTGDKTAADVVLRGEDGAGETSEITFDYVPAGSMRQGALLFAREPAGLELTVRSYTDP